MRKILKFLLIDKPVKVFLAIMIATVIWIFPIVAPPKNTVVFDGTLKEAYVEAFEQLSPVSEAGAACPNRCLVPVCKKWVPIGGSCQPTNPWDIGCCVSYGVECDPECQQNDPPAYSPPTASASLQCGSAGTSGWCVDNGKVRITASDPAGGTLTISGTQTAGSSTTNFSCGNPCDLNMVLGEGTITYRATSSVSGLSSPDQVIAFKFDNTKPDISEIITGTLNGSWYVTNAIINASASDTGSGLLSQTVTRNGVPITLPFTATDGIHEIKVTATDRAGNVKEKKFTVRVDSAKPFLSLNVSGDQQGGWYRNAVVSMSVSDSTSGIQSALVTDNGLLRTPPFALADGAHNILATATDNAGNVESRPLTIMVDSTGPEITPSVTGSSGENGWWTSTVDVNASATDTLSGLDALEISRDGGATWLSLPQSFTDGVHSVEIRARDLAGNETVQTRTISVDTIKPTLSFSANGVTGVGEWYVSPVNVNISASDAGSGAGQVEYRLNGSEWVSGFIPALNDGIHNLEFRVEDVAGNESTLSASLRVDTKPPVVNITSPLNGAVVEKTVTVTGTSYDETSGIDVLEASIDGKSWKKLSAKVASISLLPTPSTWTYNFETFDLPNGEYNVQVRAVDSAGNATLPVTVALMVDNNGPLIELPKSWQYTEAGYLNIQPNFFHVATVSISVHDQDGNIIWSYTGSPLQAIYWDGKVNGELMPHGDYPVIVVACDVHGVCSNAKSVITIPFFQYVHAPTPTKEPTPVPVITAQPVAVVETPAPEKPQNPLVAMASSGVVRSSAVLVIAGIFLFVFASQAAVDPRPSAARSLSDTLRKNIKE